MRVLIADKLAGWVTDRLEAAGCAVTVDPNLSGDALTEALRSVDPAVLVVRSTKVNGAQIAAARSLSLIVRAGAGVNTIDVATASARGVYVSNCPGKNAIAVAELTFGHLINLDRRIADNVASLREGQWKKGEFSKAEGLAGKTMAILGVGDIGREVITRAHAFGIKVRAWSRSLTPETAADLGVEHAATAMDACRGAHILSIHLALTPGTRNLVGREHLEALARGALVINTSRGEVLDQAALIEAIRTRGLRAGLDVFAEEPAGNDGQFVDNIRSLPQVYGTHHIGASTNQASDAVGEETVNIISTYLRQGTVPNCVNLETRSPATHVLVIRHADRVGVLAGILDHLRQAHVNVQEMENIIFQGAHAACARIQVDRPPTAETLAKIGESPDIFATSIVALAR